MPERVFLPSSRPLLPQIVDRLLPESGSGPLRMETRWILVPTRQAGRRLRETLTAEWRNRGGTALLGLEVHAPTVMFHRNAPERVAHLFDWMEAWRQILTDREPGSLPALLPQAEEPLDAAAATSFGQRLQHLREELFDTGQDLTRVASSPLLHSEQERWRDLASLEQDYRRLLESRGLLDPVDAKRKALAAFQLPEGVDTLILAGVPDPSPVLLPRLEALDSTVNCEVWIHAEPEEADLFSIWGVPGAAWQEKHLGTGEEPEGWIECLAGPDAVLTRMRELCADIPEHPELALGLLDPDLSRPLSGEMASQGLALYDPSPVPLETCSVARLLQALHQHRTRNDPESLRALWRQPALLNALHPQDPMELLRQWELFASESFPDSSEAVDALLDREPLRSAWRRLKGWVNLQGAGDWLDMLREITEGQELDPKQPEDRYTLRQIQKVAEVLQEAARREKEGRPPGPQAVLLALSRETVDPLRVEGTFTAEGWLELAMHPAKRLLLIGMQEGAVPPPLPQDPLLPRQLREDLGLKSDRDWLARDAYLFHNLIRSRAPGDVRVWVMKRGRDGSPLLPSRLLFACPDDELLHRTKLLFGDAPAPDPLPAPTPANLYRADRVSGTPITRLSVSDINSYLFCPTRFYFQKVLGMQTRDDRELEPDAAAFGSLIHHVLEQVVKAGPCTEREWQERCQTTLDRAIRTTFGSPDHMSARVLHHSALKRLAAAGALQVRLWNEGWEPFRFEHKAVRTCNGIEISGKVDRIDRHPEKGLRILDYKTADSPEKPEAAHLGPVREGREPLQVEVGTRIRQWKNLQLPLYRWLAVPEFPEEPLEVAYFNLPSAVTDTRIDTWKQEPELADAAEACLQNVIDLIQNQVWLPTTQTSSPWDPFAPLLTEGSEWIQA